MSLDIKQVKHFIKLAQLGNYAKAADAVHLSQSALSRSIQQLEEHLGQRLFERGRFGAILTPYGRVALEHAKSIHYASDAMLHAVKSLNDLHSGELVFGVGPYPAMHLMDTVTGDFADQFPAVAIKIVTDHWQVLNTALLGNELEFYIADIREIQLDRAIDIIRLPQEQGCLIARAEHPLSSCSNLDWAAVLQYPLALPRLNKTVEKFLVVQTLPYGGLIKRLECDNITLTLDIVAQSKVLALVPEAIAKKAVASGRFSYLPFAALSKLQTAYGLVTRKDRLLSPSASTFIRMFLEYHTDA